MLDFLLDRAAGDHLVDEHRFLLADPVRAVRGLVLGGRVPPWVVVNHRVSFRQVQAHATGLEADQKDLTLAALKVLHRAAPIPRLPSQQRISDAAFFQLLLDQREH